MESLSSEAVDFRARLLDLSTQFCCMVEVKDRPYRLRTYPQCFLGSEAVDFLVKSGFAKSRRGAVQLGRFLASEYQLFEHVCGDHELKDKHLFFRFPDSREEKNTENGTYRFIQKAKIDTSKDRLMKSVLRPDTKAKVKSTGKATDEEALPKNKNHGRISLIQQPTKRRSSLSHPPQRNSTGTTVTLDFDSLGACGREAELKLLEGMVVKKLIPNNKTSIFGKANESTLSTSSILVEGESGSGKCALVDQLWKLLSEKHDSSILVGNGKFDQQSDQQPELSVPFYCFTQAVGEIVDRIFFDIYNRHNDSAGGSSTSERFKWKSKLRDALGSSDATLRLFSDLIPRLGDLVREKHIGYLSSSDEDDDDYEHDKLDSSGDNYDSSHIQEQLGLHGFKAVFRDLFRAISSECSVVLSLHDMQFADSESILLLEYLLDDEILQRQPFLFIGTHHPLNNTSSAEFVRARSMMIGERMKLEHLTVDSVNQILHQLLKLDKEETRQLAATIHEKTQGSRFFVIQFLRAMAQRGLVIYSFEKLRWGFDLTEIVSKMDLADNVADVLAEKLRGLPETQRHILVLASALGSTEFETDVIGELLFPYMQFIRSAEGMVGVANVNDSTRYSHHIEGDLSRLVRGGFVVKTPIPGRYRFSHDKVRQAGLSFLPKLPDEQKQLDLCLGKQLQKMIESSISRHLQKSLLIFQAVGLLNKAQTLVVEPNERISLAKLNYRAAIMASARSSFFPASRFLESAVMLLSTLPGGGWGSSYPLMLQITDLRVTVEFRCGILDKSNELADEILGKAKSFEERKHAYFFKMLALMQTGESVEAKRLAINVLALLGVTFPRTISKAEIVAAKNQVLRLLQSKSDDDLLDLPQTKDPNALTILEFLERLRELCFTAGNPDPMTGMLCMAWSLETTLRHGNSNLSSISFVHFSILCISLGIEDEGHRFGELALRYLNERPGVPRYDCRCQKLYSYFVGHWRYPYQRFVVSLGAVLKEYWQKGVMENYFIDAHAYFNTYLCAGLSLGPLHLDMERIAGQMRDNQRLQALRNDAPLFQFVSNLVDSPDMNASILDPSDDGFAGDYFEQELEEEWILNGNVQPLQRMYLLKMIHCYFFNMYKEAHDLLQKLWSDDSLGTSALLIYQAFFRAMVSFAMAQRCTNQAKRQKLVKSGKEVTKRFLKWVERGNVNAHHLLLLLQAEELTTSKASHAEVRSAFDNAISAAARLGFLHCRAIGNERAGLFFLKAGDSSWAKTYLQRASNSYEDWGAATKADHIRLTHRRLFRRSRSSETLGGSLSSLSFSRKRSQTISQPRLGKSILDELSTESHHSLGSGWDSQSSVWDSQSDPSDLDLNESFGDLAAN